MVGGMNSSVLLALSNLTLGYERHPAVHHLSIELERGQMLAVVGPNGAGKSTLLKALVGQIEILSGELRLHGVERRQIAYLPQLAQMDRSFPIMVFEFVAMGLWQRRGAFVAIGEEDQNRVAQALLRLGLQGFEHRQIGTLSGGQLQRVLFARLMVQDAQLILLDEPFTGIDKHTTDYLIHLIEHWHRDGKTIIAVLHDLQQVRQHFPQTLILSRQLIALGPTSEVLTAENLNRANQLNEAFDEHALFCGHA
jgi:zinc/manganese transport system ATP-binding protein